MSRSKKPRKAYRPRPVTADTMALALHFAAKPAAADRDEVLAMLHQAVKALREGVATEHQWSIATGAVTVALAIERQGIVRGLTEHLNTAEQILQDIFERALHTGGGRWVRVTLYYQELDALQTFVELHAFQISQLGRAEFLAAIETATTHTRSSGNQVTLAKTTNLERLAA